MKVHQALKYLTNNFGERNSGEILGINSVDSTVEIIKQKEKR